MGRTAAIVDFESRRSFAGLFERCRRTGPVAVILRDPLAEIEDVIGFDGPEAAYDWLEGHIERWAGGYIALWEPKG